MHVSGILVTARPTDHAACVRELAGLPGVEVHYTQPETGRIVVVLEQSTLELQEEGLRRIQCLPRVVTARLVQHVFAGDDRRPDPAGAASRP